MNDLSQEQMTIRVPLNLTPEQVARAFCEMGSDDQAAVFHEIGRISETEWKKHSQMQWCFLGDELVKQGRDTPGWRFAADIGAFTMVYAWRHCEKIGVYP